MLTQKQKELLVFIHKRSHEQGVTPSFDEMRDALKLKSKSDIVYLYNLITTALFPLRTKNLSPILCIS